MDKRKGQQRKSAMTQRSTTDKRGPEISFGAPSGDILVAMEAMDREALLALWRDRFGEAAPKGMSLTFLSRFLAFDLQERCHGRLPTTVLAKLQRIESGQERQATPAMKPGGRLLREWNGITHVVEVTEKGYLWQGRSHRSLSAIARAITGAHWSGPRFFGLAETAGATSATAKPGTPRKKAAAR